MTILCIGQFHILIT